MKTFMIILTVWSSLLATIEQNTLRSDFTLTLTSESQPMTYAGNFTMRGEQFAANALGIEAAYDGQTMYLFQQETNELTLSVPTHDELIQTNPLLFAKHLAQTCNITEKESADQKTTLLTFTPIEADAVGIIKLNLRVRNRDNAPLMVEIREKERTTTMKLTNPVYSADSPRFVIEKPDAYLNDIR